jgi:hypothetical protein
MTALRLGTVHLRGAVLQEGELVELGHDALQDSRSALYELVCCATLSRSRAIPTAV